MTRLFKTSVVALGLAGFALTLPVSTADAFPFYHKVCETTYSHHHKHVVCHRVMFRRHPIRDTIREFAD
jgi:hypothetical protein